MSLDMNTSITDAALNAAVTKEKAATLDKIVQDNKERGLAERNYYAGMSNAAIELAQMQQYMDATQPSANAAYARHLGVHNPYAGGTNFVPAGLASYKQTLAARNAPVGSLVDAPVQIVGDPRVAPTRFEDRSQFGKILEVLAQPYDPAADHGGM